MPDTHVPHGHGWLAFAKSSLKGALAEVRLSGSPLSLVMVGLMGEPPGPGPYDRKHGWFARARALIFSPFLGPRVQPPRSPGNWARLSLGAEDHWPANQPTARRYLSATLVVAAAAAICWLLHPFLLVGSLVLPFLIAIMLTAVAHGLWPSLFASVLSVLTFDFFFLPPFYSLNIAEPDDVVRLVIFALAALIVSNLAAYARSQAVSASQRAAVAEELYGFGRQLTGAATLREVMESSLPRLRTMLRANVLIAVRDGDDVVVYPEDPRQSALPGGRQPGPAGAVTSRGAATPDPPLALAGVGATVPVEEPAFSGTEFALIKSWLIKSWSTQSWQQEPVPGSDPSPPISSRWLFVPMRTGRAEVGMMAIAREALDSMQVPNSEALFGTLADLMAQAIDRIALVDDLNRASRLAEREELHAALLASLSHDLRTPLASVLVAAESLISQPDAPGSEAQRTLARSIQSEARRLDRYIGNLLDMTRIETGLADATASRIDLADAVSVALDRCARNLHRHRLSIELADDLPMLAGDEVLLEHVLFNLLDNASKYSPPGSLIGLRAWRDADRLVIEVSDEGDGIRAADLERIFDKFFRGEQPGRKSPGIGLGLSICRGYIEAMGGQISARNRTGLSTGSGAAPDPVGVLSGAVFTITLPIPADDDLPDLDA